MSERVSEIRARNEKRKKFQYAGDATLTPTTDDIDHLLSLLDAQAQGGPRHYFCSCGGALTAEEYVVTILNWGMIGEKLYDCQPLPLHPLLPLLEFPRTSLPLRVN